jgi:hypothetical protein
VPAIDRAAAGDRDHVLAEREGGDAHREEALRSGEGTAQAGTGREMLLDQLREANEHLLLAILRAQTLDDMQGYWDCGFERVGSRLLSSF